MSYNALSRYSGYNDTVSCRDCGQYYEITFNCTDDLRNSGKICMLWRDCNPNSSLSEWEEFKYKLLDRFYNSYGINGNRVCFTIHKYTNYKPLQIPSITSSSTTYLEGTAPIKQEVKQNLKLLLI